MTLLEEPKKRPLNRWQLFLHDCRPRQDPNLGMTQKVSSCSVEYKELKEKNPKQLEDILEKVKKMQKVTK